MQIEYVKFLLEEAFYKNENIKYEYISDIKEFKNVKDYIKEVLVELDKGGKKRWISCLYKYIYEQQLDFSDYKKYNELSYLDNGVYIIANREGEVLYIGKSDNKDFDIFTRLFDHVVPKLSEEYPYGQVNNNTPEIWEDELNANRNLKIFVCCNVNFDPELLEVYLISRYKLRYGYYPKYNKETARPFIKKSPFESFVNYTNFLMKL